jgi:2-phospho-L-lactate guanylyltransferase (CobY/MobA/RfbA family)
MYNLTYTLKEKAMLYEATDLPQKIYIIQSDLPYFPKGYIHQLNESGTDVFIVQTSKHYPQNETNIVATQELIKSLEAKGYARLSVDIPA